MKLWLLRRPNATEPYKPDEGYVVRALDADSARMIANWWDPKDEVVELTANGAPGVIMKSLP